MKFYLSNTTSFNEIEHKNVISLDKTAWNDWSKYENLFRLVYYNGIAWY
ncbi:hypothetical protein ACSTS3_15015 [Aquimarina muelleri]